MSNWREVAARRRNMQDQLYAAILQRLEFAPGEPTHVIGYLSVDDQLSPGHIGQVVDDVNFELRFTASALRIGHVSKTIAGYLVYPVYPN